MRKMKVDFNVSNRGGECLDLGSYCRIVMKGGEEGGLGKRVRLQFPSLTGLRATGNRKPRARGLRAESYLFREKELFCLVLAMSLRGRSCAQKPLIEEFEEGRKGVDWSLFPLGLQTVYLMEGKGYVRFGFADLRKTVMETMWGLAGDPQEEGSWLAGKFLPRRVPAAARLIRGRHLHLWAFL